MPGEDIDPMVLDVPRAALDDLRDRLARVRLPEQETDSDDSASSWVQGPPLAYVQDLVHYWADEYDWRRLERELNRSGHSTTHIDGLDIEFLHVRSPRADAQPLIITHGWPSSIIEPLQVIDLLANPPSKNIPAFHVVAPSLPGFGFGSKPTATGWDVSRTADAWAQLMTRLGYERFFAAGGDWGGRVTTSLGVRHPERVVGLHTFTPYVAEPGGGDGDLSPKEAEWLFEARQFWRLGGGYSLEQSTKPQTIAYALADSPVAQLTWILEKFQSWTDCAGHPENAISRDRILDVVSFYWFSGTGGSSARFYWENFPPERWAPVNAPTAVSLFPSETEKLPRHWVQARYRNLQYWNEPSRGGHFPMLEVPESYARELQAGLGRLRP